MEKTKLIATISKKAKISLAKAQTAYECVLKENPGFRKQAVKTVEVIKEVPVKVVVEKIKKVEVIKEVPVEILKEITLVNEVEIVKKDIVYKQGTDKKTLNAWKKKYAALEKELAAANKKLAAKPKVITKEVEVVKSIDMDMLKKMMAKMGTVEVSKKVIGETRTTKDAKVVSRRELKAGDKRTKVSAAKSKAKKAAPKKAKKDDLKKVEGIGPKIEKLLHAAKIPSFAKLSKTDPKVIKKVLEKAGPRFQMHDPTTWPQQAAMAEKGQWEKLQKWQDALQGGKKK